MMTAQAISADEIALYDRQIRLWGVQAQEKIRNANVLLVNIRALGNEVAKNLVLAGIASLTIIDGAIVTEEDLGSHFSISTADVGKNRALAAQPQLQKLNPRVAIYTDIEDVTLKGPEYFAPFDVTIATDLNFNTFSQLSAAARLSNRPFYAAGVHGLYGFIFADLIQHDFVIEREKSNIETKIQAESSTRSIIAVNVKRENGKRLPVELVSKREIYSPLILATSSPLPPEVLNNRRRMKQVSPLLTCVRALWEFEKLFQRLPTHSKEDLQAFTRQATETHKELQLPVETLKSEFLRSFLQNLGSELSPVAAFLGGQLAQDVINVLGQREQPIQNLMLFNGDDCKAPVYALHPIFAPIPDTTIPIMNSVNPAISMGMSTNFHDASTIASSSNSRSMNDNHATMDLSSAPPMGTTDLTTSPDQSNRGQASDHNGTTAPSK
ncbi:hypothetical protein EJ05DRAFT_539868 [Pseudovirgaria hyperparasitica]|uniref:Ubiquitin-like 1-activating enzyme E1A n=1 Tax=Pseudovirgaria hyperparasitica TaxID=470096 RepID=A0A6A6W1V3_9PEZI|nr:uncharacterized protein EJ05DRAFT_539868 [Pseudovirgaria hyperparasitica]KAF2756056.1 hypothetical protein EJ05DRAFT_539868 [Pseudovirgaria hyperparasitica]